MILTESGNLHLVKSVVSSDKKQFERSIDSLDELKISTQSSNSPNSSWFVALLTAKSSLILMLIKLYNKF